MAFLPQGTRTCTLSYGTGRVPVGPIYSAPAIYLHPSRSNVHVMTGDLGLTLPTLPRQRGMATSSAVTSGPSPDSPVQLQLAKRPDERFSLRH